MQFFAQLPGNPYAFSFYPSEREVTGRTYASLIRSFRSWLRDDLKVSRLPRNTSVWINGSGLI